MFTEYFKMLAYKRPARSNAEEGFIARFILPLNPTVDDYGNLFVFVGDSDTMFTAHTDTMHRQSGFQIPVYDSVLNQVFTPEGSNCLGADDTTGIFIMLQMIEHQVPGVYAFFRDEEIGGLGSSFAAEQDCWDDITQVVSFDRNSFSHDIITSQFGGDCCTGVFAGALVAYMRVYSGLPYNVEEGVFTDSANFNDGVRECTNISVGYFSEHTPNEFQDLTILRKVLEAVIRIPWDELPTGREEEDNWYKDYDYEYERQLVEEYDALTHGTDLPY